MVAPVPDYPQYRFASASPPILERRRSLAWVPVWVGVIDIIALAWLLRIIGITRSYDIFVDEVTYTRVAENLATGHGLTLYGAPFDLHPPGAFALYALAIKVFSMHGGIVNVLFELRPFVAFLASISCALTFLLVGSLTKWRYGIIAAAIATLDPFEIYYDSHVMLEAPAQLASLFAILFLARSLYSKSERQSWALVILSGIASGFAICAKEYFGLVLTLLLLTLLLTGWVIERRKAATALTVMGVCYIMSEYVVIVSTGYQSWWYQVTSGLRRLVGSEQITGFNSSTVHVSLLSRLTADANLYGITYLILGLGAIAGVIRIVWVIGRRADWASSAQVADRGQLLVALWSFAATAYLGYATLFGTIEEQMYYLLFIPCLCALTLAASYAIPRLASHWRRVAVALFAVVIIADSTVWASIHHRSDNEYSQLLAWAPNHLPEGSKVAVTDDTSQFLLKGETLGQWATIPALIKHHVDYVLLSTTLVSQGYGLAKPDFEQYLQAHATVAFRAAGPSEGALIIYDVREITGAKK